MTLSIDLYWSFRSPYSYLATPRFVSLAETYDLAVAVRIVAPIAIRDPRFFERVDPLMPPYVVMDSARVAEALGVPFRWPRPDPVVMDMKTRAIADDQPYIHRLNALGIEAVRRGRGLAFIESVSRLIWDGATDGWHEGDHLARAAAAAGLDLAEMDRAIARRPEDHRAELDRNAAALREAGHWGVPTAVFQGEAFFGQDRIDLLVWRMKQHRLAPRS